MIPSSSELYYFIELAKHSNMRHTAAQLGITQPTLSAALKRLEKHIGTPLFTRSKLGMALTHAGERFFSQAQGLHEQWQNLKNATVAAGHTITGAYRLGSLPMLLSPFSQVLANLLTAHKELSLSVHTPSPQNIVTDVLRAKLDMALTINPAPHPSLKICKLYKSQFSLWQHPDLSINKHTLIYDPNLPQAQYFLKNRTSLFGRYISVPSLEAAAQLCNQKAGVTALPKEVAQNYPALVNTPNTPTLTDEVCLIYRTEKQTVTAITTIATAMQQWARTNPPIKRPLTQ